MAIKDRTAVLAALDLAAADLNTALGDTVNTGYIAEGLERPEAGLRDLNQLFKYDPATGQLSTDQAFLDSGILDGGTGHKTTKNEIIVNSQP